jgi:hypothetical protein
MDEVFGIGREGREPAVARIEKHNLFICRGEPPPYITRGRRTLD